MIININGELFTENTAKISVMDRGFLYGDGVYETMVAFGEQILFLSDHLARLRESAEGLSIPVPLSDEEWGTELAKTLKSANFGESVVRLLLTRGEGPLSLGVTPDLRPNWVIWVRSYQRLPENCYLEGVGLTVSEVVRNDPRALNPKLKTANFLNNLLALMDAQKAQTHEALLLNGEGFVAEGATSNVWIVKGNTLITPPLTAGILPGITRSVVLQVAHEHSNDLSVKEALFTVPELLSSDECFITSSSRGILPVTSVNGKTLGQKRVGPITLKLGRWYEEAIQKHLEKNRKS